MNNSQIIPLTIENLKSSLSQIKTDQLIIICDKNIDLIYAPLIEDLKKINDKKVIYWRGAIGEQNKTLDHYAACIKNLFFHGIHRNTHLIAIGGGGLSDFAGFIAATALRGIPWSLVPTSLLAQVDAAIGGKTSLNLTHGKNLIGSFHFPQHIFLCQEFLSTLDEEEYQSGLGEIVKYGLLSREIFDNIVRGYSLESIISQCAQYKQKIINQDPMEKNIRKYLNLGHTFGHIYETLTGSPHGLSVLWGIEYIDKYFLKNSMKKSYKILLKKLALNPQFFEIDQQDIFKNLKYDKKKISQDNLQLVLLKDVGEPYLENFSIDQYIFQSIKEKPLLVQRKIHIKQSISLPGSKSYANRSLIQASLKKEPCQITNLPQAKDTLNLIQCLKEVGLIINQNTVFNSFPDCETSSNTPIKIKTGEGGTTNRFLIPFLALGKNEYHLYPEGKMKSRPMEEFKKHLPSFQHKGNYFKIKGPHSPRTIKVNCQLTTQFASAFALSGYDIFIDDKPSPYFEMTKKIIANKTHLYQVNPDWSSASFFIVLAALAGKIHFKDLQSLDPCQADSSIIYILRQIGSTYTLSSEGLFVEKNLKHPFHWDCSTCPDIFPPLVFLASYLEGTSTLTGFEKLPYKESNRLEECLKLMDSFNITHSLKGDTLSIHGGKADQQKRTILTAPDHRMIMTAYLFLRFNGGGELHHFKRVDKSFPEFFNLINS